MYTGASAVPPQASCRTATASETPVSAGKSLVATVVLCNKETGYHYIFYCQLPTYYMRDLSLCLSRSSLLASVLRVSYNYTTATLLKPPQKVLFRYIVDGKSSSGSEKCASARGIVTSF